MGKHQGSLWPILWYYPLRQKPLGGMGLSQLGNQFAGLSARFGIRLQVCI